MNKIHLKVQANFKLCMGINFPCLPLFSVYWGIQPHYHQEKKVPHAHDGRGRLILSHKLCTCCTDWAALLPGQKGLFGQGGFGHRVGEAASESSSTQRHVNTLQQLWAGEPLHSREDIQLQQRGRESLPKGQGKRNVINISFYIFVTIFQLLWEILEKMVIIVYSKTHVKSSCEQYNLFAAYNFLFQAVLNSFVWGEGMNKIPFSIHILKLASLLPALENIQKNLQQWRYKH